MKKVNSVNSVDVFDYVVVGGGSSGSVIANRLSEDGRNTVCVLEAGPVDRNIWIHIPAGFTKTLFDPSCTWQFKTEPTPQTNGRAISATQGRVLGGSSSVNGMNWNRGQPADLDAWAQRGNRGWGYADMLPYYRRTEKRIGIGDDAVRGRSGAIPITDMDWFSPVTEAFIAGCVASGIPRNSDYNGGDQAGVGYFQRAIDKGRRVSAARAYLRPAYDRKNLEVRTECRASAVVVDRGRATGVRFQRKRGGAAELVQARREVILCAGTVNTARLLQVSGIGPVPLLKQIGVPVVQALPGVGANFQDHYAVRIVTRAKAGTITLNELAKGRRLVGQVMRWAVGRSSILSTTPSQAYVFWPSDEALDAPDLQCVFSPGSYKQGANFVLDNYPGMTAGVWAHRPQSVGHVHARSSDVYVDPVIQPNYLDAEYDRQTTVAGLKLLRRLLGSPQLAPFVDRETLPGPDVRSDDELLDFAYANGGTAYHLIGTARMGPASDPTAVVDDQLRVHSLQSLRVADASIMPAMISGNTYATTLMIAEKAADLIKT